MPMSDDGALAVGTIIAGCQIVRLLGRGGMGEVYLARHLRLDKPVALKLLPPAFVGSPQAVARFQREAKLAAKLTHPNVIKILDVGQEGNDHYILMDYVEGSNLVDLVKRQGGPLPWKQALRIIQLAARGTGAVHKRGLIHRDIKPANIMLSDDRQILLMDFGLAREVERSDVTTGRAVVGTPAFMSPEQSRAEELGPASDVFSLGSTLYYLLTARLPYEGSSTEVLIKLGTGERPQHPHAVNPYVPRLVSDFVLRVMAPKPQDRPAGADALATENKRLLNQPDTAPPVTSETEDGSKVRTTPAPVAPPRDGDLVPLEPIHRSFSQQVRHFLPWAAAILAVLLSVASLGIVLSGNRGGPANGSGDNAGGGDGGAGGVAGKEKTPAANPPPKPDRPGMVYIPAGEVQVGNEKDEILRHFNSVDLIDATISEESFLEYSSFPPRKEKVSGFYIDKYEVTNEEYARFVAATGHPPPEYWKGAKPPAGKEQHGVAFVTYTDALAYAEWAKKKLPTEAQWLRAFRGDKASFYPWGNRWEPARANVWENGAFREIVPVTATPNDVSGSGVYNLVGNLAEMMRDTITRQGVAGIVLVHGALADTRGDGLESMASSYSVRRQTFSDGFVGFRCVIEDP